MSAYPWPSNLDEVLLEVKAWDQLWEDRRLVAGEEWPHHGEVEVRLMLLRHALETGQPAASWDDVEARFQWKRYAEETGRGGGIGGDGEFLERLAADFAILRAQPTKTPSSHLPRTNAEKRTAILAMMLAQPTLSDREIARRLHVSPQTVSTWRKKRA